MDEGGAGEESGLGINLAEKERRDEYVWEFTGRKFPGIKGADVEEKGGD